MLTHTSTFESLAVAPVKQSDVIVARQSGTLGSYTDDVTMKWTSSTVLMSVGIDAVGEMLGATTKKATVRLLGIVSGISARDLFQIRLGLWNTSAFLYVSQGFFLVDTVDYDYDAQSTTVTMYDHIWTAGETIYSDVVTSGDLTYPATVEALAGVMASKLGVSLMSGFKFLPNATYSIAEDLYTEISNATLQNVIQEIASATGTTARMSDTTLVFSQFNVNSENLNSTSLRTLKIGNTYGPVNSLVLGRVPQNDNITVFSQAVAGLTVTANATTNLFTATTHHLIDGDIVQFSSTGTLPAPLVANTSYYVFTNANANTFALVPKYSQATQAQYGLTFDGTNDTATIPGTLGATTKRTYYVRIRIPSGGNGGPIYSDRGVTGDTGTSITLGVGTSPAGGTVAGQPYIYVDKNATAIGVYGTGLINDGKWHDLVAVANGAAGSVTPSHFTLYVDGVQVSTSNQNIGSATWPATGAGEQRIGRHTQWTSWLTADIDEFTIWQTALSATEIGLTTIYNTPNNPTVRYKFSEGTGTSAADSSGNGTNATLAGTPVWVDSRNIIDLTTAGTGTITAASTPRQELQINNNEILDDSRETLIAPLYDTLSGLYWTEVKSDTVGLGWHEVGDVIQFTQGAKTVRAFLSEVHLTLAASIKEQLVSKIPDPLALINQQTAGGILKTLHNAEIKVDKQANEIISIVEEQQVVNDQVQTDFTEIRQDVDSIDFSIQNSGGNNLLVNSVGYATDSTPDAAAVTYNKLYSWDYLGLNGAGTAAYTVATHGTVVANDSSTSQSFGGVSGRSVRFDSNYGTGKGVRLTQRVNVAVAAPLSFGVRVYSAGGLGTGTITLSNTNESQLITINNSAHNWTEYLVENFTTTLPWVDVIINIQAQAMELTDLRLMYGSTIEKWTQADTELMSTNVQFTKDGIRVYDPLKDMETHVTNSSFQTIRRADGVILFEADNTGVRANDFTIRGSSDYYTEGASVIKQITIPYDDPKGGIAFLKGTE